MNKEIKIGELTDADSFIIDWSFLFERGIPAHMLPILRRRTLKICLVGSSKFMDAHIMVMRKLTLCGCIVLPMGLYGHREMLDMGGPVKKMLDMLHFDKIDVSDAIFVVNPGGYIGSSTSNEIHYARKTGKRVMYLVPDPTVTDVRPAT